MTRPFVTVLIDTYNQEPFIEEAILSVLRQNLPSSEVEILVVDDGSIDNTPVVVRQFEPTVRLIRKRNGGQASAFNVGISEARGELIAFLDGDDFWAPGKLTAVVDTFLRNPNVGLVGHGITEIRPDGTQRIEVPTSDRLLRIASVASAKEFRMLRGFLGTSRMSFRTDVLRGIGPVPESLRFEADEYLFTVGGFLADILILDKAYTYYRVHDKNLYQITNENLESVRRKRDIIAKLADCLGEKLRELGVSSQPERAILECVEVEARVLQLQVDNGYPWETVSTELQIMRIFHEDASFWQQLFTRIRLLPALLMPAKQYYQLRGRLSGLSLYREIRKRILPFPVPKSVKRIH